MLLHAHVDDERSVPIVQLWLRETLLEPATVEVDHDAREVRARLVQATGLGRTNLSGRRILARVSVPLLPVSLVFRNVRSASAGIEGEERRRVVRVDYADGVFSLYCSANQGRYSYPVRQALRVDTDAIDVEIRIEGTAVDSLEQWDAVFGTPKVYY